MKLPLKSRLKQNKSSIDIKNPQKIISSRLKKISIKKSSENSKNLSYSNSNSNLFLNNNKYMSIDNITELSYNKEPFIIPNQNIEAKKFYTSNVEKAVQIYNEIKEEINNKIIGKNIAKNTKNIQVQNYGMVSLLEKLNKVLDTIVERSRYNQNKNKNKNLGVVINIHEVNKNNINNKIKNNSKNIKKEKKTEKEINNNLLNSYIYQFNLLSSKYEQLTKGDYISSLKSHISNCSSEIINYEKENRELKRTQSRTEVILKNKKISENEQNYKNKLELSEKLNNEINYIENLRKIKEGEMKCNEERIKKLNKNNEELMNKAKDDYNITNPEENLNENEDINDENNKIKYNLYIKRKDLENKNLVINNNIKKYTIIEKDNKKLIKELEENLSLMSMNLTMKKEEIIKLNEILEKLDIENNTFDAPIKNNLNSIEIKNDVVNNNIINNNTDNINKKININEINKKYKIKKKLNNKINNKSITNKNSINLSQSNAKIKEINDRYSALNKSSISPNNNSKIAKTYNKKMILQQLDAQRDDKNNISLRKKNLKPNFSFSLNNSSKKSIEKNDKNDINVNLSMGVISKSNNLEKNEPEEIKEDINITPYDAQKITNENNLSQNISLDLDKKDEINKNNANNSNNNANNANANYNEIKEEEKINENIINDNNEFEEEYNENNNKNKEESKKEGKEINEEIDIQNINNDNNNDEKNRQNALNTLPFYELEKSEKSEKEKINEKNEEKKENEENKENKEIKENKENREKENQGENEENYNFENENDYEYEEEEDEE